MIVFGKFYHIIDFISFRQEIKIKVFVCYTEDMSSIFSKIIEGEILCYKVYEDEKTLAFLDIHPETVGHVLVVPKLEVDKIYDLPEEDYLALMKAVKRISKQMEEVLQARIFWKVIGTDVPHAHVHLLPFDEKWVHGQTLELDAEEMKKIQNLIRLSD